MLAKDAGVSTFKLTCPEFTVEVSFPAVAAPPAPEPYVPVEVRGKVTGAVNPQVDMVRRAFNGAEPPTFKTLNDVGNLKPEAR